jgi:alpha-glucoside transport system substrate-binding protein
MKKSLIALAAFAVATLGVAPASAKPAPSSLTVMGPYAAGALDADALEAELAAFTTENRVEVTYEEYFGSADLVDRVTGPNPPDLIIAPQPGTLEALAPDLVDLADFVNPVALRRDFGNYLIDLVTVDGAGLGAPIRADLKSLVWYRPDVFAANGYQIPETFAELVALSDAMVTDGMVPWCNYIESGFATGWLGTDWVEDLVLGAEGPAVYDDWVDHSVIFADLRIEMAFERYQQMIDTPGYVFDRANMLAMSWFFNAIPLGEEECLMHRQASFFLGNLGSFGYDIDEFSTFDFPTVDPTFADAAVGGGVYLAAVNDSYEVRQLTRFMVSQQFGREALADSDTGWILPNVRFDTSRYGNEFTRSFAETIQAALLAGQFRFDASDLMPPQVSTGTFWTGITDLVAGAKTIPQVLNDIDASWPI